jgi:ribosomal protein L14E/L6E/L27E
MEKHLPLGQRVSSTTGRDRGCNYFVVGYENGRVLVADGKRRKLEHPKRKNPMHLKRRREQDKELGKKLQEGQKVTNAELTAALSRLELENNTTPGRGGEEKLG